MDDTSESTKPTYAFVGMPFHLGGVLLQRARVSQEYVLINVTTGAIIPCPPTHGNTLSIPVPSQEVIPVTSYH